LFSQSDLKVFKDLSNLLSNVLATCEII